MDTEDLRLARTLGFHLSPRRGTDLVEIVGDRLTYDPGLPPAVRAQRVCRAIGIAVASRSADPEK